MVRLENQKTGRQAGTGIVESMPETARNIVGPSKKSANWRCSDCAWSQPFVRQLELIPNVPSKAVQDAFDRHKCTEHRHPKWTR